MTKTIHQIKAEVEAKLKQANLEGVEISIEHQILRSGDEIRKVWLWKGMEIVGRGGENTFALSTDIAITQAKHKLNPINEVVTIKTK